MGFRVSGLGVTVWGFSGLGFGVWGLGFSGLGFRVWGLGLIGWRLIGLRGLLGFDRVLYGLQSLALVGLPAQG